MVGLTYFSGKDIEKHMRFLFLVVLFESIFDPYRFLLCLVCYHPAFSRYYNMDCFLYYLCNLKSYHGYGRQIQFKANGRC